MKQFNTLVNQKYNIVTIGTIFVLAFDLIILIYNQNIFNSEFSMIINIIFIILIFFYFHKTRIKLQKLSKKTGHYLHEYDQNIIASRTDTKGVLTNVSKAFCDISEYSRDELIGKTHQLIRHPNMDSNVYTKLWDTITHEGVWNGEILNISKNGHEYWVNTKIFPDYSESDELIGFYSIGQDITTKKQLEHEIEQSEQKTQQLVSQSKFVQMGEMLSMIAHQWRQPLASISAISNTLLIDNELDSYDKDFFGDKLNSISSLTGHLSETINDFRNFFKEEKTLQSQDVQTIVQSVLDIIEPIAKSKGIKIKTDFEDPKLIITTYLSEFKQVLLNLVKNAEDVLLENNIQKAHIDIKVFSENEYVIFQVCDNGGGIPEDIKDKIFEPYFSTKLEKDGTGLGLYMSKVIIEEHCNGAIEIYNCVSGACFTIKLKQKNE